MGASQGRTESRLLLPGSVPNHLVGRAFDSFTEEEEWRVKAFRLSRRCCESCGNPRHHFTLCSRRQWLNQHCIKNGLCHECQSPDHEWQTCPKRRDMEAKFGAKLGEPYVEPRAPFDPSTDAFYIAYMKRLKRESDMCEWCMSKDHRTFACPKKPLRVNFHYETKIADIAPGETVLHLEFSSPLTKLPPEVRMKIFLMATQKRHDIVVQPEYLNTVACLHEAGLPFAEVFEAFIRSNCFRVLSWEAEGQFENMLHLFDGTSYVRAVCVAPGTINLPRLIECCPGLARVKFTTPPLVIGPHLTHPVHATKDVADYIQKVDLRAM